MLVLSENWIWFAIGMALVMLEALAPGIFLFWLGLAAFALAFTQLLLLSLGVSLAFAAHLALFAVFSLVMVAVGRIISQKAAGGQKPNLNRRAEMLIDRTFPLESPIIGGTGTIRVDDTIWRVKGPDLPQARSIKVLRIDGADIHVGPAD